MNTYNVAPATNPVTATTPVTGDRTADVPPPATTGTIHPTRIPASIKATSSAGITISRTCQIDGTAADVPSSTSLPPAPPPPAMSNRPERRTAPVARDLARDYVDIAALSETNLSEQDQLEDVDAGYTFCWSGRPKA
ncbi:hypothetical protein SprV_0602177100 [Sparganum proliferum]